MAVPNTNDKGRLRYLTTYATLETKQKHVKESVGEGCLNLSKKCTLPNSSRSLSCIEGSKVIRRYHVTLSEMSRRVSQLHCLYRRS